MVEQPVHSYKKVTVMHDLETIVARNNAVTNPARITRYRCALEHWLQVGYSYETARALAAVLHGQDADVRAWADSIRSTQTDLRREDML